MYAWSDSDSISLVCLKKWHETPDTVSFELGSIHQDLHFNFKPGQFITLGLNMPEKMDYRAYSIASDTHDNRLKLTVKRVEGGLVSNFIVDELDEGDEVAVLKPAGEFNCIDCQPTITNKVTLVSAGCGITPVIAMAKYWLKHDPAIEIDFIHMARSKQETIYFEELHQLDETHSNFSLKLLLKDNQGTTAPQGRLDKSWLVRLSPDILERTVYLCGPVGFMQNVESYLTELEFNMENFYQESFTPISKVEESQPIKDNSQSGPVEVFVPAFGAKVEADLGTPLADSLEKAGVPIIIACRSGICGSCKCKVTKGSVTSSSQETLTADEIEQGYVLACSSTIDSEVEVELG
ncbi:hybrid-cluster NAD(P)-dependent oxidoreductase [Vibrio sp. D404a]|uniref:hybrid-cluster NAD(P)-dependent oxidoreductase n=1 Tax=unclassified Vibrio TaxID=2614977 RepID=UPI0025550756|nr:MULTISPECIES: hybrid-cluster NAD(P)-dependent oxidoreductase [unclassified Vibrio]MDK9737265.1 hybrid-cluster NAD(P)-dependent oxidoreductase [Vibrio sp. D404a]MDK9798059.1 hybrid-cluster NAD(P)-dependent oxidoreductase [Vibrio sp. D449a]